MIIRKSIEKEEIKEMPKVTFPGQIHIVNTPWEAEKAIAFLRNYSLLGIDSETRPSFNMGQIHKVALLQVASVKDCFLFRLNLLGLTVPIITLLETPHIIKVGLSLKDDFMMLHKRAPFEQHNCIELQDYVREFGITDKSHQKIYAILFEEKITKSQRLSNWEAEELSIPQQLYAATDAWACLKIYQLLEDIKSSGDFQSINEKKKEEVSEDDNNILAF